MIDASMSFWTAVAAEASAGRTGFLLAGLVALALVAKALRGAPARVLRAPLVLFAGHLALVATAAGLALVGSGAHGAVRLLALMVAAVCAIKIAQEVVFSLVLPRAGVRGSRLLSDVVTAGASIVAVFALASRAGFNVSGLIATSAVLTAVVGLALRDTLGNVIGGLSLQTDRSIHLGDWIKVGEVEGRVVDIRWRYTAVETRNGETLIVPNGVLTTEKVMVLGRRQGAPPHWRRWVHFNVDLRQSPSEVVRVVTDAIVDAAIPGVAAEPAPDCLFRDVQQSFARYAVRYWLTDFERDLPTDSAVLTRVYFALQRAGIALAVPEHAVLLTEQSSERTAELERSDLARRRRALEQVEILRPLGDDDRDALAARLVYAPFARGERLTRQGDAGDWLYLITAGEVSVRVAATEGLEQEVAHLGPGDFVGEMSLMTGERRSATVVATSGVECYRLDKAAFQDVLRQRPAVAEPVAELLARRRVELGAARENLDQEARTRRVAAAQVDLLRRIRDFFGLHHEEDARRAH
jgi:small-conductance mechanosensitive channel/CRP-like cAMP-binding protein